MTKSGLSSVFFCDEFVRETKIAELVTVRSPASAVSNVIYVIERRASETLDQSKNWNHPSAANRATGMQRDAKMRESHERRNVGSE